MATKFTLDISRSIVATGLIAVSVVAYSLVPLFVAWGGNKSPFVFMTAWNFGMVIACTAFLMTSYRSLFFDADAWRLIWHHLASVSMIIWVIAQFGLVFYAWSTQFVDVSVSLVMFECWPIMLVILTGWLFRHERRYRKITPMTLFFLIVAFLGVICVVISQIGGVDNSKEINLVILTLGFTLAFSAAGLTSLGGFGFRWGADLAIKLSDLRGGASELFCVVVGVVLSTLLTIPATAVIGFAKNEPVSVGPIMFGIAGGVIANALGTLAWRKANLITHHLSINIVAYFTPVLGLGWLLLFSLVGDVRIDYLIIGALIIVVANIGIHVFDINGGPDDIAVSLEEIDLENLVDEWESNTVEFKATLRTQISAGNMRSVDATEQVIEAVAGFLNTDGGIVVIGIDNDKNPIGVHIDGFPSEDNMGVHLDNILTERLNHVVVSNNLRTSFQDYRGVRALLIHCIPYIDGADVKGRKSDDRRNRDNDPHFYVRRRFSTIELHGVEVSRHLEERRRRFG